MRAQGLGVVGLGDPGDPSAHRTRPDLCADHGHPLCTFHPQMKRTWCLCGEVSKAGEHVTVPHVACCGGVLTSTT